MSMLLSAGGWGHLGHLSQKLSSPSSAPMPTVVKMVSSSCLPLSLPSSHATQGFQEELPPWVAAQHPLSRRTPMPGHQPPEGQGHTQLCWPWAGGPQRPIRRSLQEIGPTSPWKKGHPGAPGQVHGLTLGFLLPKECLGDFSKQTLCWVGGTQLWSHHTAAGRELLRCVALQRGQDRGLVSTAHALQAEQLPWADCSPSQPS